MPSAANSTSSERRLTRVVSPNPVYGDALASFRSTGAGDQPYSRPVKAALTSLALLVLVSCGGGDGRQRVHTVAEVESAFAREGLEVRKLWVPRGRRLC